MKSPSVAPEKPSTSEAGKATGTVVCIDTPSPTLEVTVCALSVCIVALKLWLLRGRG
jgi:hypothetical protein